MKELNGKKGLILVALLMAAMLGAYAAQYYTWTVEYTIQPLTSSTTVTMDSASGATAGTQTVNLPSITLQKESVVFFMVSDLDTEALEADYYNLIVTINAGTKATNLLLVYWGQDEFHEDLYDAIGGIQLDPGTYTVTADIAYFTGAVAGTVSGTFTINVFAREVVGTVTTTTDIDYDRYNPNGYLIGSNHPAYPDYTDTFVELAGGWFYQKNITYIPEPARMTLGSVIIFPDGRYYTWSTYTSLVSGLTIKEEFTGENVKVLATELDGRYIQYSYAKGSSAQVGPTGVHYTDAQLVPGKTNIWWLGYTHYTCHPASYY